VSAVEDYRGAHEYVTNGTHWVQKPLADAAIAELEAERDRALDLAEQAQTQATRAANVADTYKMQLEQCVWMLHTAAQEYMTGSRAVISWIDYIHELGARWTTLKEET
jgi:hypothetical protein